MADRTTETYTSGQLVGTRTDPIPVAETNREDLETKARAALATNATFLAIASPSNAQVVAQVKALTRQNNAIIRLLIGALDDAAGT